MRILFCIVILFWLAACSTPSRYSQAVDSTPVYTDRILSLPEPSPIREPLSRRGNASQYEVWGKTYQVQLGLEQYQQTGIASWYGQKFHGHETSNGEIFDVYQFTAAHKTLPLPSYVKVTNLDNQKSIIVRVNDRGPFHEDRLIDLSYAAAVKLDFHNQGTASVAIEMIAPPLAKSRQKHLQIEAYSQKQNAEALKRRLEQLLSVPVYIAQSQSESATLHKVRIGPIATDEIPKIQGLLMAAKINAGLVLP